MHPIRAPLLLVIAVSLGPAAALAESPGDVPIIELAPAGPSTAGSGAGKVERTGGNGRDAEPCGRLLAASGLPPSITPCPGPEPVIDLPQLEVWHASTVEQQGRGLGLLPASIKLDARPGGEAGPRELGLAAVQGLHLDANGVNGSKLARDTGYLGTMGVIFMWTMIAMPESVSRWDTSNPSRFIGAMPRNWSEKVSQGPLVDQDRWAVNYIGHPVSGSFYYQVARHDGFGVFGSTLYSAMMSTLFWEYGLEAFAEVPSLQDLIVTPLGGAVLGEAMYQAEQAIDRGGGMVLGSRLLGGATKALLNPVGTLLDGVDATVVGSPDGEAPTGGGLNVRSSLVAYPMSYPGRADLRGNYVGFQLTLTLP